MSQNPMVKHNENLKSKAMDGLRRLLDKTMQESMFTRGQPVTVAYVFTYKDGQCVNDSIITNRSY